jgi:hypothetical protein
MSDIAVPHVVAKLMGMNGEPDSGRTAGPGDDLSQTGSCQRPLSLAAKNVCRAWILPLESA